MIGLLAGMYTPSDEWMSSVYQSTVLQTSQVTHTSKFICFIPLLHWPPRKSAMMFDHIYGVASFIVMLVALLCVFKMYLALTATCRVHRAFLLESATREEKERVNRGQRELEADRRSNAEEERPRRFARLRLPVEHDERRSVGVSIIFQGWIQTSATSFQKLVRIVKKF